MRCYSQRMLNPYHGIVNVVEIPGADAVTRDGRHWALYIQGGRERERMADGSELEVPLPDIKFGTWDARRGLQRAPVRYVTDYEQLDALGSLLLEQVKAAAARLPFPAADRYERWLLHADDGAPLALLESACDGPDGNADGPLRWNPGQAARSGFDPGPALGGTRLRDNAAEELARRVNGAAGRRPVAAWYRRAGNGGGECLDGTGPELGKAAFPPLLLREHWPSGEDAALAAAYLDWQAPWLLALQDLAEATRRRLERQARARALLLDQLYPTYPRILDTDGLKAARVEARLRRSAADGAGEAERPGSNFFVSGN